jgi:predicted nucleic acid-binding protein
MSSLTLGLDTSCLVTLFSSWHEFHEPTLAAVEAHRRQKHTFVVAIHALVECFAVLTRIPQRVRISPREAAERLAENLSPPFRVVGLSVEDCWAAMNGVSERGLTGALVYDAIIARSCASAGASILLTWNIRAFLRVAPAGLHVQEPDA